VIEKRAQHVIIMTVEGSISIVDVDSGREILKKLGINVNTINPKIAKSNFQQKEFKDWINHATIHTVLRWKVGEKKLPRTFAIRFCIVRPRIIPQRGCARSSPWTGSGVILVTRPPAAETLRRARRPPRRRPWNFVKNSPKPVRE